MQNKDLIMIKILLRLIKASLAVSLILYLSIRLNIYLTYQIGETIIIMSDSIEELIPYATKEYSATLHKYVAEKAPLIYSYVRKGEMTDAFRLIQDVFYYILTFTHRPNAVSRVLEIHTRYLYNSLQLHLPYLELMSKLFFLHFYLKDSFILSIESSWVLTIIVTLIISGILLKLYIIYKE